jgi:hypothetical protein
MLLSEKKVWDVVDGKFLRPKAVEEYTAAEQELLKEADKRRIIKEVIEWDEKNEEALRVISFTVSDRLQNPIVYGITAKGAWDELKKVHAPNDKQRKYSLIKRLYRLDMPVGTSLIDHESTFDNLVQNLAAIGKTFDDPEELNILYANSLPAETFGNWIQGQMAFIDTLSITDFKGRVREEARRLNLAGLGQGLGFTEPDTVQANIARQYGHPQPTPRLFPPKRPISCWHCGFNGHTGEDCHKRIAEEYLAKQAKRQARGRGRGRGGRGGGKQQKPQQPANSANVANANEDTPAYSSIFGGLAYCCKAAVNHKIKRVNGVWIKDCGATHHMHHNKSLFSDYHALKNRLYVGGIGSGLMAVGVGNVSITDPANNTRILQRVLHVPKLKNGLMSLNTLALEGWTSTITKDGCIVTHGKFKIHSPIKNGLCV